MRKLDTHSLQIFTAVAECLSFRQAAEQLHISQPPLSRAVRQLEDRLGLRLFERDTRGVALTPAGRQLLPRAQQILALLDAAELALAGQGGQARLRLGLTTSVDADRFRQFNAALAEALGPTRLELSFADSPRLVAHLRAGRLDAALVALPTRTFDWPVRALASEALLVALPARHPLARRRKLALADLAQQPVYWFERPRQPAFFDHAHAVFRRHGFAPAFLPEPHDHHVLLGDVAAGKGVALLPASFAALRRSGVAYRALLQGEELAVGLGLMVAPGHPAAAVLDRLAVAQLG